MASQDFQPSASDERVIEASGFDAELFWAKHGRTIIVAAAAVVLVAVGAVFWIVSSHYSLKASEALLAQAKDANDWQAIIAKYPKLPAATDARFLLAESLRQQGKTEESNAVYQQLLKDQPDSPLAGGARLGLAENALLAGKIEEALANLRSIQADPSSYAAPFAGFLEARILVQQNKLEDARRILSNLVSTYQNSPSAHAAGALLDDISPLLPPEAPKKVQAQ